MAIEGRAVEHVVVSDGEVADAVLAVVGEFVQVEMLGKRFVVGGAQDIVRCSMVHPVVRVLTAKTEVLTLVQWMMHLFVFARPIKEDIFMLPVCPIEVQAIKVNGIVRQQRLFVWVVCELVDAVRKIVVHRLCQPLDLLYVSVCMLFLLLVTTLLVDGETLP